MVGPRRRELEIEAFLWDFSPQANVDHIAAHGVSPLDVEEVKGNLPHFFDARPDYEGHVMLGPNHAGRYLYVAMVESRTPGLWQVITAHWMAKRRAERLYLRE